jgi:hypothetical protein
MSLELVNTLATFGAFVVIAATAIAAIVQLRHARSSNHIAALNELRETMESPGLHAALVWENFEYLTVLAQNWVAAHTKGTYPAGVRRIELKYPWLEADKQYAASPRRSRPEPRTKAKHRRN